MSQPDHPKRRSPFSRLGELFDASALGLVTLLLLGASFFATWRGMGDFIASRDLAEGAASKGLVLLIVATLSLAMYVALREMISPYYVRGWWSAIWKRVIAGILYVVLAVWSVGFGYGFWWSLVAGQNATETALERSVASIRQETSDVRARLAAAGSAMGTAEQLSNAKAEQEASSGGTCGVSSPAGAGPLARARSETQAQIAALAASVQKDWQAPMETRLAVLEADLQNALDEGREGSALVGRARKARFEALGRDTQTAARDIGADATARGRTIAAQLRAKAEQLSAAPDGGRVAYCYDPDLAAGLNAAADELDQIYNIEVASFEFAEGPDGVARAIEDLLGGIVSFVSRQAGLKSNVQASGMSALAGRDLIALMAAIGVDLALFVFALLRGSSGRERLEGVSDEAALYDIGKEVPIGVAKADKVQKALAAPAVEDLPAVQVPDVPEEDIIMDAEYEEIDSGKMLRTFDPGSQLEEVDQIADLLGRVQQLMEGIGAATLAVERSPLQNKLSDTLRALRKFGYFDTGSSDKVYNEALHEVISAETSERPKGHILQILRPGFLDAEGRLREKARVVISAGSESI